MVEFQSYKPPIAPAQSGLFVSYVLWFILVIITSIFDTTNVSSDTENSINIALIVIAVIVLFLPLVKDHEFNREYIPEVIRIGPDESLGGQIIKGILGSVYLAIAFPFLKLFKIIIGDRKEPIQKKFLDNNYIKYYLWPVITFITIMAAIGVAIYFYVHTLEATNSAGIYYLDPQQRTVYQVIFSFLVFSVFFSMLPDKMAKALNHNWTYYLMFMFSIINIIIVLFQLRKDNVYRKDILWTVLVVSLLLFSWSIYGIIMKSESSKTYRILVMGDLEDQDRIEINGELFAIYDAVRTLKNEDSYFGEDELFDSSKIKKDQIPKVIQDQLDKTPKSNFDNLLKRLDKNFVSIFLGKTSWEKAVRLYLKAENRDEKNRIIDAYFASNDFRDVTTTDIPEINKNALELQNAWKASRPKEELPPPSSVQKIFSVVATSLVGQVAMSASSARILNELDLVVDKATQVLFNRFMFVQLTKAFEDVLKCYNNFLIYDPREVYGEIPPETARPVTETSLRGLKEEREKLRKLTNATNENLVDLTTIKNNTLGNNLRDITPLPQDFNNRMENYISNKGLLDNIKRNLKDTLTVPENKALLAGNIVGFFGRLRNLNIDRQAIQTYTDNIINNQFYENDVKNIETIVKDIEKQNEDNYKVLQDEKKEFDNRYKVFYNEILKFLNKEIGEESIIPSNFLTGAKIDERINFFKLNNNTINIQQDLEENFPYKFNDDRDKGVNVKSEEIRKYIDFFTILKIEKSPEFAKLTSSQKLTISKDKRFRKQFSYYFPGEKKVNNESVDMLYNEYLNIFNSYVRAMKAYLLGTNSTEREIAKDISLQIKSELEAINKGFPPVIKEEFPNLDLYERGSLENEINKGRFDASYNQEAFSEKLSYSQKISTTSFETIAKVSADKTKAADLKFKINTKRFDIFNEILNNLISGKSGTINFETTPLVNINFPTDKNKFGKELKQGVTGLGAIFSSMTKLLLNVLFYLKDKTSLDYLNNSYCSANGFSYRLLLNLFASTFKNTDLTSKNHFVNQIATDSINNTDLIFCNSDPNYSSDKNVGNFLETLDGSNIGNIPLNNYNQEFFERLNEDINNKIKNVLTATKDIDFAEAPKKIVNNYINGAFANNNINYYLLYRIVGNKVEDISSLDEIFEDLTTNNSYETIRNNMKNALDQRAKGWLINLLDAEYSKNLSANPDYPLEALRKTITENSIINALKIII